MIESSDTDQLIATGLEYPSEAAWQTTLDELSGAAMPLYWALPRRLSVVM